MNAVTATSRLGAASRVSLALRTPTGVILARLVVIAVLVAIWEIVTRLKLLDALLVPSPQNVATTWTRLIGQSEVQSALTQTASAIFSAFLAATLTGIAAGFIIGLVPIIRRAYYPAVLFLLSTPKVVFVPIFLLIFGLGPRCVAAFGAFQAFFYVTVTVVGGVGLVGERELRVARAFRATRIQTLRHVTIPATSHALFAAIWFGITQAFTGALIVELFVSAGGVGQLMSQYERALQASSVVALALTLAVAAVLCGVVISWGERKWCRWRSGA